MNGDTEYEMVAWYYPYGGDPIAGEVITYAAGTCEASSAQYIFSN